MCSKDTYRLLFKEDGFTSTEDINSFDYLIKRKQSCINLMGISYSHMDDVYISRNKTSHVDIIDAIMAYDEQAEDSDDVYVTKSGKRTSLGSSKYFTPFNREYIAKYANIYSVGAMSRQLKIPTKELDKYITRYHTKHKDSTNPVLVVWDVRAKYDDVVDNILHDNKTITDDDIDALLGLV